MTYLGIVNSVLKKLREQEATSVADSTYTKLIGELVNDTLKEVQDAWYWSSLRTVVDVTTVASTSSYTLTGTNDASVILDEASFNLTNQNHMIKAPYKFVFRAYDVGNQQQGSPLYYTTDGQTSSGELKIKVIPEPKSVETLRFYVKIPQGDLLTDGSDNSTEVVMNSRVIILGAYYKALEERGDNGTAIITKAEMEYSSALSDQIAIDVGRYPGETTWQVD